MKKISFSELREGVKYKVIIPKEENDFEAWGIQWFKYPFTPPTFVFRIVKGIRYRNPFWPDQEGEYTHLLESHNAEIYEL